MPAGVAFVHNNFPGQFRDLAQALMARGVPCAAIGAARAPGLPNMPMGRYGLDRGTTPGIFPFAVRAEADLIRGAAALRMAKALKAQGFDPAVIVGHPGWGETIFLDEVWPDARRVMFAEFFYRGRGLDIDFDNEFLEATEDAILRGKAKNAVMTLALADADVIVTPTEFQASVLPSVFQPRVRVIHEGVDVDTIRPGPAEPFALADDRVIAPGAPVITHVNNHLEPLRGLHIFARSLPRLMAEVPDAQVLVIGQDTARPYGGASSDGRTWREVAFDGLDLDPARLHFLGKTPHARMLEALRLSTAHVYYTYPFVLSWSLVEAMASGCYVVASDTPPLHDAIQDGVNGRLLPFFDFTALSETLIAACRDPRASVPLRAAARATAVAKFASRDGRAAWFTLLQELGLEIPTP
ncbi:glycosyltransferase [Phenylobacterium sp.]|jgi:glycosyltransferase involved in cell wall biosynthesis|uniref:glycosyltransferase n=1 Tax=Phenylobacterium sp. TaxID=1871053 RepID=UPI002E33A329|nr:glycosyltransferase [Phenylobacterium sp.]HEX4712102.1 glycosyltransferase [Phenylobacterium sp.]